jgi:hypothetical protein
VDQGIAVWPWAWNTGKWRFLAFEKSANSHHFSNGCTAHHSWPFDGESLLDAFAPVRCDKENLSRLGAKAEPN